MTISGRPATLSLLTLLFFGLPLTSRAAEVTSLADAGPGSLRQALLDAAAGSTITFAPALFAGEGQAVLSLTSGPLTVAAADVVVVGPGPDRLRLDGAGQPVAALPTAGLFDLPPVAFTLTGLSLAHASGSQGYGAIVARGSLTRSGWRSTTATASASTRESTAAVRSCTWPGPRTGGP